MESKIYMSNSKKNKEILISIIVVIIITIIVLVVNSMIKKANYHKTYEYKLLKQGYSKEEVNVLLDDKNINLDHLLEIEYNENIVKLLKEKYYLNKNLDKYLSYINENSSKDLKDVVAIINVHSNNDWYTNTIKANTELNTSILVNKFYYTDGNYEPEDLSSIIVT